MPLLILFVLFLGIPLIEVYLFIVVGGAIGAGWTIALCIATAAIGAWLDRLQGLATVNRARQALAENRFPADVALDGICLVVAGFCLMTPGFFTDAVGFLLLVPPFRRFLQKFVLRHVQIVQTGGARRRDGTIDGDYEVVDEPVGALERNPDSRWRREP
jgi:UPF0716 protein FxsA